MSKQLVPYLPGEALLALYRRRGPVINSGVGRHGYTYLLGADANKFVFANADAFSWRETFENLAIVDGPTALIVSDGADHQRRRSVIAPGLRHREIQNYVQTMASTIDTVIDGWRPGQRLDIYREFRSAVRRSTAESLFGPRIAAHSDFLGAQLQPLLDLTHQLPQVMQMQRWAKTPAWRRAMTARARINDLIDAQIAEARSAPRPDDHMLTMLINGRGDEGYALSDNEIRDSVISLITAGYETTSGALAWATHALLTVPGAWDAAADEVRRVCGDRPPGADDLAALTYLNGVVHETLRLYPPGSDLRPQGDARPPVRRTPHSRGTVADLQRLRDSPDPRGVARPNRIPAAALGSRLTGLPQARTTRVHPVQRRAAPMHRGGHGDHRDDRDARPAGQPDQAPIAGSADPRTQPRRAEPSAGTDH